MNGSVFIINENALYCSNDADITTERVLIKNEEGKSISSKHTEIIRVNNFMIIKGELSRTQSVYCQFMSEETDEVKTFSADVSAYTEDMIILNLKALNLHNKEIAETIKKKIKEEISNGRN